jgi:hypothetical protein
MRSFPSQHLAGGECLRERVFCLTVVSGVAWSQRVVLSNLAAKIVF